MFDLFWDLEPVHALESRFKVASIGSEAPLAILRVTVGHVADSRHARCDNLPRQIHTIIGEGLFARVVDDGYLWNRVESLGV